MAFIAKVALLAQLKTCNSEKNYLNSKNSTIGAIYRTVSLCNKIQLSVKKFLIIC